MERPPISFWAKKRKMASFKLFLFLGFLFFFLQPSRSHNHRCSKGCGTVPIRFPFQLFNSPPEYRCGYSSGFNVFCQNETPNTLITFPSSINFTISNINYSSQLISIVDPSNCIAKRLLEGFDYKGTPFQPLITRNFTFLNCTPDASILKQDGVSPIACLSTESYSIVALPSDSHNISKKLIRCRKITTLLYPTAPYDLSNSVADCITLTWTEPNCGVCESMGYNCQFKNDSGSDVNDTGSDVTCFGPYDDGLFSKTRKYIALVVVATGMTLWGIIICFRQKIVEVGHGQLNVDQISTQRPGTVVAKGLDKLTIEMYPTTMLGESLQLPNPTDNMCPICLLEYQAKDMLRTIPSCKHYFHVDCIDEWLKRNSTCPLCRN